MNWHKDGADSARRGYHHGNLREALIEAALRLIAEKGPAGFSFAEAARSAGVSAAAPYRHYRDRDALIADVAKRGYEMFAAALAAAWAGGTPTPRVAFDRLGAAYLEFARAYPSHFSAMFESGISLSAFPEVHAVGEEAFRVLKDACEVLMATLPKERRAPPMMVALHFWSLAHGMAVLFGRGDAARRPIPMAPAELLEAATLIYFDGLGGGRS